MSDYLRGQYNAEHKKAKIMLELENLEVVELTTQEVQEVEGGWPRLTGFLDGIDGNLKWHWW